MNSPSNDLKAMADAPKPDFQERLREWILLLNKLRILDTSSYAVLYGISDLEKFAEKLGWMSLPHDDGEEKEVVIFLPFVDKPDKILSGEYVNFHPHAYFMTQNQAVIGSEYDGDPEYQHLAPDPMVEPFVGFKGTWEEVARKLFELEKLLLAKVSVPEVPGDLKS